MKPITKWITRSRIVALFAVFAVVVFLLFGVDLLSEGTHPKGSKPQDPAAAASGFVSIGAELATVALEAGPSETLSLFGTLPGIESAGLLVAGPAFGTWTTNPTEVLASLQNLSALMFDQGNSGNSSGGDSSGSDSNSNPGQGGTFSFNSGPGGIPGGGSGGSGGSNGKGKSGSSNDNAPCTPMPQCGWTEWTPDSTPPPDQSLTLTDDMGWPMGSFNPEITNVSNDDPPSDSAAVPEPASLLLVGSGLMMVAGIARRRTRRA